MQIPWKDNLLIQYIYYTLASLVGQSVKNLPAMQETWVWFLGQEDPLEKEITTYSSILAWRIPWTEDPGRLQSMGSPESDMTWRLNHHHHHHYTLVMWSLVCISVIWSRSCEWQVTVKTKQNKTKTPSSLLKWEQSWSGFNQSDI